MSLAGPRSPAGPIFAWQDQKPNPGLAATPGPGDRDLLVYACGGMGTRCGVPSKGQGPAHVPLRWDGCSCIPEVGKMLAPREAGIGAQVCIMAQGVSHVLVTGQALGCAVLCWDKEQPCPRCGAGSPDRQECGGTYHQLLPPCCSAAPQSNMMVGVSPTHKAHLGWHMGCREGGWRGTCGTRTSPWP